MVSCGDYHTMCLTNTGKVFVWGGSLHSVNFYKEVNITYRKEETQVRKERKPKDISQYS